eukprot:CAMPEP_0181338164 /NCGR_PEP_ID=MMETSP1101-20121128/28484_1 /TAXON_ID=46948 /ORGANISM="Rhodomonas abbreviata, Strain Caron Lab Isolate" /LENGTH=75 /DNA_ID=CAMNT_0023448863 /DNA_START=415 /DNA_END=638 /DNA_ORIENTATION=+
MAGSGAADTSACFMGGGLGRLSSSSFWPTTCMQAVCACDCDSDSDSDGDENTALASKIFCCTSDRIGATPVPGPT